MIVPSGVEGDGVTGSEAHVSSSDNKDEFESLSLVGVTSVGATFSEVTSSVVRELNCCSRVAVGMGMVKMKF